MSYSSLILLWLIFLILSLNCKASSFINGSLSSPRRSILREITGNSDGKSAEKPDYALELNATNFDAVLKETPATYAVVEFFAHWKTIRVIKRAVFDIHLREWGRSGVSWVMYLLKCPACRNYKPHYEKVARLFNGPDAVHPGIILMTRVDCALSMNTNLCDKFSVGHYPMLLWGPPSKFLSGNWDPKQEKSEIRQINDGRTADRLLNWINQQMSSSYGLDDEKYENENTQTNASDPGQIARAIYDVEEATSTAYDIILRHKMIKPENRASLISFLQLLAAHHPSRRCRKGSAEVLVNFDDLYPSPMWSTNKLKSVTDGKEGVLQNIHICGKEVPRGYWIFCRGSKNDTRGFSCGLWVLLHSLSVRVEDGESQMAFTATCNFIHNFFVCEECRQHFYDMCSSVSNPFKTAREYVLWLWQAHNKVNTRLKKEEESLGTGDPKYPKTIWPSKQLCPSCYLGRKNDEIEWNNDKVFEFLIDYYGRTLVSVSKDKEVIAEDNNAAAEDLVASTNAVAVPAGAAFAILVASCAFGGLAWFWRSRQKNRKQRRSWN